MSEIKIFYKDKEKIKVARTISALKELDKKDIILTIPSTAKDNKTVRVLKIPKTESSVRKVFIQ